MWGYIGVHLCVFVLFLVEAEFLLFGRAGLKLPNSDDPPALASQSAGITGVNHHAQPEWQVLENYSGHRVEN